MQPALNRLSLKGNTIHLEPKVMEVLICLAGQPGEVVSKERFLREVWADTFVTDEVLTRAISELRKAFGDSARAPAFIETIPKSGYRLIAPVTSDSSHGENSATPSWITRGLIFAVASLTLATAGIWLWMRHADEVPSARTLPLTTDEGFEEFPALSPDGNEVAYIAEADVDAEAALFVKAISGSGPNAVRRIASHPVSPPVWSPDGHAIAFYRRTPGESGVYVVPADGSDPIGHRILPASWAHANLARLSWSGEMLAFADRDGAHRPYHISILSLRDHTTRKITTPPESTAGTFGDSWPSGDFWPVFSPDGSMLAFVRSEKYLQEHLYVTSLDGSDPQLIASDQSRVMGLTWTPDGSEIIYSSNRSGGFRMSLWRIGSHGGTPRPVAEADANALDPSMSRAGTRLVYTQAFFDTNIWRFPLADASASAVSLITSTSSEYAAAYSPDGQRIAFDSARTGAQEIWVCNADGSNPVQLTFRGMSPTRSPRWSPDGRWIAFDSREREYDQIWIISSQGGEPRKLTDGPSHSDSPRWSQDGNWVYFRSRRNGRVQIWKVSREGGPPVAITTQAGRPAIESRDGRFLYYAADDSSSIWKVPLSGGPEVRVYDFPKGDGVAKWAVTEHGIYFGGREEDRRPAFYFFDFDARRKSRVGLVNGGRIFGGMDVSADGHWLLAAITEGGNSDLKLIEGFR